ncbi:hypothetical protein M0813_28652 [Anaeramoeba flamelloides]|uniref:START domain-containing protein n=1 Tax=Anaeramoeba flamelloides TaxID=1746091 RepID=A0AAV7Y5E9_9EUKA|nr:hypothetical protein M0812_27417 [Anaeramoeba flamelloides]KAJ6235371.1 hypothetical protein M0813_28652 [Anaeramoeba flamelloides]
MSNDFLTEKVDEAVKQLVQDYKDPEIKWNKAKSSEGIQVFTRKTGKIKINRVKAICVIDADPEVIWKNLCEKDLRLSWDTAQKSITVLKEIDPETKHEVIHTITNPVLGGIISSREYVDVRIFQKIKEQGLYVNAGTSVTEKKAGIKKVKIKGVRGFNYPSGFVLEPLEQGVKVCYITQSLTNGWLLTGTVNSSIPKVLWQSLKDLKNHILQNN